MKIDQEARTGEAAMIAVSFRATLKPGQVETPLDLFFFRPAAYLFVRLALPTPLTANGMTVISILCGLAGAALFRFTDRRSIVAASALTLLYAILDCAGGQLARALHRAPRPRAGRPLRPRPRPRRARLGLPRALHPRAPARRLRVRRAHHRIRSVEAHRGQPDPRHPVRRPVAPGALRPGGGRIGDQAAVRVAAGAAASLSRSPHESAAYTVNERPNPTNHA